MHTQEHILNTITKNLNYFEVRTDPDDEWGCNPPISHFI